VNWLTAKVLPRAQSPGSAGGVGKKNGVWSFNGHGIDIQVERYDSLNRSNVGIAVDRDCTTVCAMVGYLLDGPDSKTDTSDTELMLDRYVQEGIEGVRRLDGIFTAFFWDAKKYRGTAVQDVWGGNLPLYFARVRSGLVISTCLRHVLIEMPKGDRKLDMAAVEAMVFDGFMAPGERSLVSGVSKLTPGMYLTVNGRSMSAESRSFSSENMEDPERETGTGIIGSVKHITTTLSDRIAGDDRFSTLSGGFDSPVIIQALRSCPNTKVHAMTIGGRNVDEIPLARKTARLMPGLHHGIARVKSSDAQNLPDMVWRTEGYVFERGLFLQYRLGELARQRGVQVLFASEGADQIIEPMWYQKLKNLLKKTYLMDRYNRRCRGETVSPSKRRRLVRRFRSQYPVQFDTFLDCILKKSGMILNSFDVLVLYPYMNRKTLALARMSGLSNVEKRAFKKDVRRMLGWEGTRHMVKIGGCTDIGYLIESERATLLRVLETCLVRELFTDGDRDIIRRDPLAYGELIMQLVYLHLFSELFISGNHDHRFTEPGITLTLDELMG